MPDTTEHATLRDRVRDLDGSSKFSSRHTRLLYALSLDSGQDETTGSVDSPVGWLARFGRHTLSEDEFGFCYSHRFDTEDEAVAYFEVQDANYSLWDAA